MKDIDARIERLLDELEVQSLTAMEITLIKDKIEYLQSLRT